MKKLHPIQSQLLKLLKQNIEDPLTIRDLGDELNISSPSVVYHHVQQLEKKGYLKRNPNNPRDYSILSDSPEKKVSYLNMYGLAHCGPRGSILDGNPIDRIPVLSKLISFPSSEGFMVKAKGDSMSPKISNGDLVIVKKTNDADSGSIIVCVNEEEALIKKIKKEKDKIILISINSSYDPFIAAEDFRIEGEVKGILTYNL